MPRIPKPHRPHTKRVSRNFTLIKGIERYGRSKMFHKTGGFVNKNKRLWKKQPRLTFLDKKLASIKKDKRAEGNRQRKAETAKKDFQKNFINNQKNKKTKKGDAEKNETETETKTKTEIEKKTEKGGPKKTREPRASKVQKKDEDKKSDETASGETKSAQGKQLKKKKKRAPGAYEEQRAVPRRKRNDRKLKTPRLRKSITKGTILILLTGRFRGRRVVFLKQLKSGLLLVTGPFKLNGIPLRRVNQAYVIATSTRVQIPYKVPEMFDDNYFKKSKEQKHTERANRKKDAFETKKKKKFQVAGNVKVVQRAVDKPILEVIKKTPYLRQYLRTRFSIQEKMFPHLLKF